MESTNYPQPLSPKGANGKWPHWIPLSHSPQAEEANDDGFDFRQVPIILRRRMFVVAGVATAVLAIASVKAFINPKYQSGVEILVRPWTAETQVVSALPQALGSNGDNRDQAMATNVNAGVTLDDTTLKLLMSQKLLMPVYEQIQARYPDYKYETLYNGLIIKPIPNTTILSVKYADPKKERIKFVLEAIAQQYLNYSLQERLSDVRQGIRFIEAQLPQLKDRFNSSQARLQELRQRYNLVDPDSKGKELSDQLNLFRKLRLENQALLQQARNMYGELQRQLNSSDYRAAASTALNENPRYQKLLTQLNDLEGQLAGESSLYVDNSPNVKLARDQVQKFLPLLREEGNRTLNQISNRVTELSDRDRALARNETQINADLKQLAVVAREYNDLLQDLKIATDNLNLFSAKREALRITEGQRQTPWQLLAPPGTPSPSQIKTILMLGAAFGLLLGAGTAILVDRMRNVFYTPEDLKKASRQPLLGVIPVNPRLEEEERVIVASGGVGLLQRVWQQLAVGGFRSIPHTDFSFLESFRCLYTNLRLMGADHPIRSVVVSSATPQDGKSTVAMYLAQVAAATGQRVLLVDTELRRPQLHYRLGLVNDRGLGELVSLALDPHQIIQQSPLDPNLSVLTAGQPTADPVSLLSSPRMQDLMRQFREDFDLVIYDSPPMLGFADANLVAARTDGLLMVARLDRTDRSALAQVMEQLRISPTMVLGLVANASRETTKGMYAHYQSQSLPVLAPATLRNGNGAALH